MYYQLAAGRNGWVEFEVNYLYVKWNDNDYYTYDEEVMSIGTTFTYKWYWNISRKLYFHIGPSVGLAYAAVDKYSYTRDYNCYGYGCSYGEYYRKLLNRKKSLVA